MKAWTDYPFTWLGDTAGKKAPVREIEVISYDDDKYCKIKVCGVEDEIKAGYVYQSEGRYGESPTITKEQLDSLVNQKTFARAIAREAYRAGQEEMRERAVAKCADYATKKWTSYKGIEGPACETGLDMTLGESSGGEDCCEAIRALEIEDPIGEASNLKR